MKAIALIASLIFFLSSSLSHAAEAPKSTKKLENQATHIVRGKVLDVATQVEKSKIETDPGVHKDTIYTITVQVQLATCRFVAEARDMLLVGPPGTGKSHLAQALGREAIRHGHSVFYRSILRLPDSCGG